MGIKETKELVAFGLSVGELVAGLQDGFSFDDVKKAVEAARLAGPGLKDAELALGEYLAMNDVQALELETFIEQEFDIPSDNVELAIETALRFAIQARVLVNLFLPKT